MSHLIDIRTFQIACAMVDAGTLRAVIGQQCAGI
jgi:hypothetical protein